MTLANKVGCSTSQSPKGTCQKDKGLSKETKAAALDFYEKSDVTWQAPGKLDRIIRRVSGKIEYLLALYIERSTFYLLADNITVYNRILNILQVETGSCVCLWKDTRKCLCLSTP